MRNVSVKLVWTSGQEEMSLKIFLIKNFGRRLVWRSKTIWAEGIMRNISVKLFKIWTRVLGGDDVFKIHFI